MKELSLEKMKKFEGGELTDAEMCGLAIGIVVVTAFNPWALFGAMAVCLTGDSQI